MTEKKIQRKIDKRRRRENRTNYKKRLILLKGSSPRLVIRKTNRYLILQIVESLHAQDKIISSVTTKELLKHGWPEKNKGSLKSLSAAYLCGLLLGKKTKGLKMRIILDSGLVPSTSGSRIYAAVKGIADSGLDITFNEKVVPSKERIEGANTKIDSEIFNKIKGKIK
jgi:large subunit ribosomal protein L18